MVTTCCYLVKMGAWGYQLFNSDNEFDVVISDMDEQARKLAKDPKLTLYEPKNKKRVVKKLNDGLFHELLQLFIRKEWKHGVSTCPWQSIVPMS